MARRIADDLTLTSGGLGVLAPEHLLDALINAPVAVLIVDFDDRILWRNNVASELWASHFEARLDSRASHLFSDPQHFGRLLSKVASGKSIENESALIDRPYPNGGLVDVLITMNGCLDEGGLTYARCFIRDVTKSMKQVSETEARLTQLVALEHLSRTLQSSKSTEAAYEVLGEELPKLFAHSSGALFMRRESRFEQICHWGVLTEKESELRDCWALQRARIHTVQPGSLGLACRHCASGGAWASLCIPLVYEGNVVGLLHLRREYTNTYQAHQIQFSEAAVEQIALVLSNISLRESLIHQSIRDSLTGIYNRRYMIEVLEREAYRCRRHGNPMGVMMVDIDHFKTFNDLYGHAAGDAVLRHVGQRLEASIRAEDTVCRYGGEEFTIVMPGARLEKVTARAETLRQAVGETAMEYNGRQLGSISISIGVAIFPDHGESSEEVLRRADIALLHAKASGRNRTETFGTR